MFDVEIVFEFFVNCFFLYQFLVYLSLLLPFLFLVLSVYIHLLYLGFCYLRPLQTVSFELPLLRLPSQQILVSLFQLYLLGFHFPNRYLLSPLFVFTVYLLEILLLLYFDLRLVGEKISVIRVIQHYALALRVIMVVNPHFPVPRQRRVGLQWECIELKIVPFLFLHKVTNVI